MKKIAEYNIVFKNLKTFRKLNNLTQAQVAVALEMDRSTYAYYESGRSMPSLATIDKLLKMYNIKYDDLFKENNTLGNRDEQNISQKEELLLRSFRTLSNFQQEAVLDSLDSET